MIASNALETRRSTLLRRRRPTTANQTTKIIPAAAKSLPIHGVGFGVTKNNGEDANSRAPTGPWSGYIALVYSGSESSSRRTSRASACL